MAETLDRAQFRDLFKQRSVVLADLPAGPSRDLATEVHKAEGRGDGTLRTRAELVALFFTRTPNGRGAAKKFLARLEERTIDRDNAISVGSFRAQLKAIHRRGVSVPRGLRQADSRVPMRVPAPPHTLARTDLRTSSAPPTRWRPSRTCERLAISRRGERS
jgi:hypothetical protein